MAHKQHINNKNDEKSNDQIINLSNYIPEPKSLYQILKLSDHIISKKNGEPQSKRKLLGYLIMTLLTKTKGLFQQMKSYQSNVLSKLN